jgi:ribonuclease-3
MDRTRLSACEEHLGYRFERLELLNCALTHSSAKTPDRPSNERLEFLGDAILGVVISEYLFRSFPSHPEGQLTKIKSVVVSAPTLARSSRDARLDRFLTVGKGVGASPSLPDGLVADAFEAVVAAIYLDGGLGEARAFILRHLERYVADVVRDRHAKNYKSRLQDFVQKIGPEPPTYRVVAEEGPDHAKRFTVVACVGEREFEPGHGSNKKRAEQRAAREALETLLRERAEA